MKKLISLLCTFMLLLCSVCFVACDKTNPIKLEGDVFVITVEIDNVSESGTLKDYMDYLVAEDELTYEIKDGMITSIDGKSGSTNQYWMLYINDTENANKEFAGTYNKAIYYQANVGAESLIVKDGCIYIWYLQTF